MRALPLLVLLCLPCAAFAERVTGTVTIVKDGAPKADRSGIVIVLQGAPVDPGAARPRIMQKDQQFAPSLTVVAKGATIDFPNEDKVFHNVFSVSDAAKFDLGLYKSGDSKSVTFKRAGVVDVYCNIHPNMVAKVKVVDGPFALTGTDGSFAIDVPPGTYPIVAWQAYGAEWRGEVQVDAGKTAQVAIPLVEGQADTSHPRKDGTPYGRYK
jgi:plastocyanin